MVKRKSRKKTARSPKPKPKVTVINDPSRRPAGASPAAQPASPPPPVAAPTEWPTPYARAMADYVQEGLADLAAPITGHSRESLQREVIYRLEAGMRVAVIAAQLAMHLACSLLDANGMENQVDELLFWSMGKSRRNLVDVKPCNGKN